MLSRSTQGFMDLPNTVISLARDPNLVAWRPRGIVIRATAGLVLERTMTERPYRWRASFADIIAGDWLIGTTQQFIQFVQQLAAEEQT